jgi:hypothetical protein
MNFGSKHSTARLVEVLYNTLIKKNFSRDRELLAISGAGLPSSGPGPHYLPVTVTRSDRESGEAHPIAQVIGPDRIELIGK